MRRWWLFIALLALPLPACPGDEELPVDEEAEGAALEEEEQMEDEPAKAGPVEVGDRAPGFALSNQRGETVRLSDYRGEKNVVLAFYPKDFTGG